MARASQDWPVWLHGCHARILSSRWLQSDGKLVDMSHPDYHLPTPALADWQRDAKAIAQVRRQVFILEQRVPEALEWETRDPYCDWYLARDSGHQPVGIARLVPESWTGLPPGTGIVGRMAVLAAWRGRGLGALLLAAVLERARRRGLARLVLHAQTHAESFYARRGFLPVGDVFEEAGIPHRCMELRLEN